MKEYEKKLIFKVKVKEKWEKSKQFCKDHKEEITLGTIATVLGLIKVRMSGKNASYSSSDDSVHNYSYDHLRSLSYDELDELRENIRLNEHGERRRQLLQIIDTVLREVANPRKEYAKSLSNDALQSELENARSLYYEKYENYRRDKRPYAELIQDEDYKEYQKNYDKFYQLMTEKERRYAEEHPDEFPIHREHGWYLPED